MLLVSLGLIFICARAVSERCGAPPVAVVGQCVDLNHASLADLTILPGVGRVTASRLIRRRPYASFAEVESVLGAKVFDRIRDQIRLGD